MSVFRRGARASQRPLLRRQLLYDDHRRPMYPSHANKSGKRYRYYITNQKYAGRNRPPQLRLPAHDLETTISTQLAAFLTNPSAIMAALEPKGLDAGQLDTIVTQAAADAAELSIRAQNTRPTILRRVERIDLAEASFTMTVVVAPGVTHNVKASIAKVRRGTDVRLVVRGPGSDSNERDEQLVTLVADALAARAMMLAHPDRPLETLASDAGLGLARFKRLLRLSFLAPDIVEAIVDGRQPATLTVAHLNGITNIPLSWREQRSALGFE